MMELRQAQPALWAQAYQARAIDAIAFNWSLAQDPSFDLLAAEFESGRLDIGSLEADRTSKLLKLYYVKRTDMVDGIWYIAPVLVVHYIAWHKYRPPQQFLDAVQAAAPYVAIQYCR
ncbi:MAG: hypothetical protein OEW35_13295 [Gammaproteobacteria bacterium]|nr:hypothetical protein [Gammaproteobacteria bacterium]MDH4255715.1 hypothetical protein [Gammaproteobacteria bacterium]